MDLAGLYEQAQELLDKKSQTAIEVLNRIVSAAVEECACTREVAMKVKEQAILTLGSTLAKNNAPAELGEVIQTTRAMINQFTKAKAAKLLRELVDRFLDMKQSTGNEVSLCEDCIQWARKENRVFLRQALEARLVALYVEQKQYTAGLNLANPLLHELKRIDDKALLVEVQLVESRAYHELGNTTKSRAALTSAKTTANGIYCPPKLQASLDLQSGVLHAKEKDYKTAYSYFYEAFESFDSIDNSDAVLALKYMLLCKIMLNNAEDVQSIVTGKLALKYTGPQIDAILSIAKASQDRSIAEFEETVREKANYVKEDPIVQSHLEALYDSLLEQNLVRIIEPFSKVEVSHIADIIKLPLIKVEKKLSQMILDKTLQGILDQGQGVLILFEDSSTDLTYTASLEAMGNLSSVVDALYSNAQKLH